MNSSSIIRTGFTVIVAAALAACASPKPPANVVCEDSLDFRLSVETAPIAELLLRQHLTLEDGRAAARVPNSFEGAIAGAMEMDGESVIHYRRHNTIVLSGGGEFGAYGSSFLESWLAANPTEFDVVTGVSTGALQATGVFLGGADDMRDVTDGFDIDEETDLALRRRSFGDLPLESSVYDLSPARERFEDFLTEERLTRVADAAREGRKLLVGVVEVQDGQFYAFDLTAIAASDRGVAERKQCYVEAVFASAAVPVIFPPVLLDDRQYFDGGVRASLFIDSAVNALQAVDDPHAADANIYVLFNGYLETAPVDAVVVGLGGTVARTREIAFDQIDRTSLHTIAQLKDRFNVSWARVEPNLCRDARAEAPDEEIFNAPFMACLIREGRIAGAAPDPFSRIEP